MAFPVSSVWMSSLFQPLLTSASPMSRAVAVAIIAGGLAFLHFVELSSDARIVREVQNAGHAILFGVIALLALAALRGGGIRTYAAALLVTLALGGLSEWLQSTIPTRDASLGDWLRDAGGAVAFLCVAAIWRRDVRSRRAVGVLSVIGAACLLAVAAPVVLVWQDYRGRDAAFPQLCCVGGTWEKTFFRSNVTEFLQVPAPKNPAGEGFLKVNIPAGKWPGFRIREVYPDWSGYELLAFDIYAEVPAPTVLVLRVDDRTHDGSDYHDRFNLDLTIESGLNRIRVPIREILNAPAGRQMDASQMDKIFLFAKRPQQPFTLWFNGFSLVRDMKETAD